MRLENTTGTSSKFWEAKVEGSSTVVRYGKIGTAGQEKVKKFGSAAEAEAALAKLQADKLEHGYVVADGFDASPAGGKTTAAPVAAPVMVVPKDGLLTNWLSEALKAFKNFGEAVELHDNPPASDPMGFLKTVTTDQKLAVAAHLANFEAQLKGPLSVFLEHDPATPPTVEQLSSLRTLLEETAAFQKDLGLPAFALNSKGGSLFAGKDVENELSYWVGAAIGQLPQPVDGKLSALSKAAFAALPDAEKKNIFKNADALGYQTNVLSDWMANDRAVEVMGKAGVNELLELASSRADDDADPYTGEADVTIDDPHISEVEAINNGTEDVAFRVMAYVHWGSDSGHDEDIITEWFVDAQGKKFDEYY